MTILFQPTSDVYRSTINVKIYTMTWDFAITTRRIMTNLLNAINNA